MTEPDRMLKVLPGSVYIALLPTAPAWWPRRLRTAYRRWLVRRDFKRGIWGHAGYTTESTFTYQEATQ